MDDIQAELKNVGIKTKWFGVFKKSSIQIFKELSRKWGKYDKEERKEYFKCLLRKLEENL